MILASLLGVIFIASQQAAPPSQTKAPLAAYFQNELARIQPLAGVESAHDWFDQRRENRRRMLEMLGLWPMPPRSDLAPRVTKVTERPDFVVENLIFQSMPGLYVTGNLYRPKAVKTPLPTVLYVCGHSKVEKDGVIYGNKAHYQHHAAWFAANGYVCLVLDTLQLGELPGLHHGMYREGKWWWQSRGYTPAGVEAWNGVRALDYLETRPEVDTRRMGVTGRSGGGATSWWLGAIDDRLAAVAPVAGITDLADHVVNAEPTGHYQNGVIEGHCDCMYICNTYRWDYDAVAALVAPKPLLIENTDADSIFPIAGVKRIHEQVAKVYGWYGVPDRLSFVVGSGGHEDSVELRHAAFAFFEKWLKGRDVAVADIDEPDRKVPIELLKVLKPGEMPADCRNATIDESFVAVADEPPVPKNLDEWEALRAEWMKGLRERSFRAWPVNDEAGPLNAKVAIDKTVNGVRMQAVEFDSQPGIRLRLHRFSLPDQESKPRHVFDQEGWQPFTGGLLSAFDAAPPMEVGLTEGDWTNLKRGLEKFDIVFLAPRGVGPTAWPAEKDVHMRRRFYLLGQTLESMQVWDIRRGLAALASIAPATQSRPRLIGIGSASGLSLWAAVFEPNADLRQPDPATALKHWPALLNANKILRPAHAYALPYPRSLTRDSNPNDSLSWPEALGENLGNPDWMVER